MKYGLIILSVALMAGCSVPQPRTGIANALLTPEAEKIMERSHSSLSDLSRKELYRLLGQPDSIRPHLDDESNGFDVLRYVYNGHAYTFVYAGNEFAGVRGQEDVPVYSDPSFTEDTSVFTNPFSDFDVTNVAYVTFSDGFMRGPHVCLRDPVTIKDLYERASKLSGEGPLVLGSPCGNLVDVAFCNGYGNTLATFNVVATDYFIEINSPEKYYDKCVVAESKELALFCFAILAKHVPDLLLQMKDSNSWYFQKVLGPDYPFNKIEKKASNKEIHATN